ncbi:MAG: hypothetical protein AAB633_00945 [Patescibacteria group bacterium]
MSREEYDDRTVEIQEPAINEIKKPRSCAKRACGSGCGCAALMIVLLAGGMWLFAPPKPEKVTALPDEFPASFPLYKPESITGITHTSAERKKRGPEAAAIIPKIVLTPVFVWLKRADTDTRTSTWRAIREAISTPITTYTNTTAVTWEGLGAEPEFIDEWYYNELSKQGLAVTRIAVSSTSRALRFTDTDVNGAVSIDDHTPSVGTDSVTIRVEYP